MTDVRGQAGDATGERLAPSYRDRAKALAPLVEAQADEIERRGSITEEVHDAFARQGLYWLLVPEELGGGGQGIVSYMETVAELSRADGSSGWVVMACSGSSGAAAGFLPPAGARKLYGGRDKAITASQLAPIGKGTPVNGGFRVSGHYQFGSGSTFATWMGAGFAILDDGKPRMRADGQIDQRIGFFPRESVELLGNWDATGLVGTGSFDYAVAELAVDDDLTFERLSLDPVRPEPVFALGLAGIGIAGHASVALGLTERALQEVATITDGKKRNGYSVPVGEYPIFMQQFAIQEANFQAARRYVLGAFGEAEETAAAGRTISEEQRARLRQAATWAHYVGAGVVDFCRLWGGTQAFRNPSALGRVVRDMGVATQHVLVDPKTLADAAPPILRHWVGR
ncbi:MAG TPA: acyl-CoA dehydrogenase family protein [Amycolatopsis sp.]|nr:acyl-CoA dehydrogenase family protein [Amycolatopsis sp.]